MYKPRIALIPVGLMTLAACATANPPTLGNAEFNTVNAQYLAADTTNTATDRDALTGRGTYTGRAISDASFDGEEGYKLIADMTMSIDFDDNDGSNLTGGMTNINIVDDRNDDGNQRANGTLTIAGTEADGQISATASGTIGAVLVGSSVEEHTDVTLDMSGDVRDTVANGTGSQSLGTFTGAGSATGFNGIESSFSEGRFILQY